MKGSSKSDVMYVISNLIWLIKAGGINLQSVTKIMDNLYNFVFLSLSPSSKCWGTMSEAYIKQCYGFTTLHRGREGILNAFIWDLDCLFVNCFKIDFVLKMYCMN